MVIKVLNEFLPKAEDTRLGAIKVGETLDINEQGTLEVSSYMNVMARTTNAIAEIPYALNIAVESGKFIARAGTRYSFANSPYNLLPTDQQITTSGSSEKYVCVDSYTNLVLTDTYNTNYSLPIAKITIENGNVISIDELYPGFGYTNDTVFVLPGVKGLIPAGRLANGGLNNDTFEYTVAKKVSVTTDGTYLIGCNGQDLVLLSSDTKYNEDLNGNILNDTAINYAICGKITVENGEITKFTSRPSFHALDYYDMNQSYARTDELGDLAWKNKVSTNDIASGGIAQSAVTGLVTALENKEPKLTWDNTPTEDSQNPVKSGGVYSELVKKQNTLTAGTGIDITNNTISENSIAYVNYNTSLYADITELINSKKIILCKYDNAVYQYTGSSGAYYIFTCTIATNIVRVLRVDTSSTWSYLTTTLQPSITGAATTVTSSDLTASRAVISNSSGKIAVSDTTDTELSYVHGVTSAIQTQLNNKVTKNTDITASTHTKITYDAKGLVTSGEDLSASDIPSITLSKISDITATATELNVLDGITATTTELNYTDGVTSNIQTQLDNKITKNSDITGATHTKITYDSKGLVTSGSDLNASDIPSITLSKISDITASAAELNTLDGITASTAELNILDGVTASTSEINILDGLTTSTTELNYVDGVTSSIQTQLNNKQATISDLETIRSGASAGASALQSSDIINTTASTATDKPLSANMGKSLQDQIDDLKSIGRFLSLWNCVTGRPTSDPEVLPYTYHTGDYFLISTVASSGQTNYKPNGSSYTGSPSTTIETQTVKIADMYYYDGSTWQLSQNSQRVVSFGDIEGSPSDNTNLKNALDAKVTGNTAITGGTFTKVTVDSKGLVTSGTTLSESDIPVLSVSKLSGVTANASELNILDGATVTTSELNVLDGITASTTELNYVDGVTSNIQIQLNAKATDTDVVHKTGAETIDGYKTFIAPMYIKGLGSNPKGFLYQGNDSGSLYLGLQDSNGDFSDNVITLFKNSNTNIKATLSVCLVGTTPATTNVTPTEDTTNSTQLDTVGARNTKLSNYQPLITSTNKLSADLLSEGSNNKLVSQTEKNTWNAKQAALTAGTNIDITNNVISTSAAQVIIRRHV